MGLFLKEQNRREGTIKIINIYMNKIYSLISLCKSDHMCSKSDIVKSCFFNSSSNLFILPSDQLTNHKDSD